MINYHYQHCKDGEVIRSGQFMADSLHKAKHFALIDSGLKEVDAWLFNKWHDSRWGSVQFRSFGGDNWRQRIELNQEYLAVCLNTEKSKQMMLGIDTTPTPAQLPLF